jgi:2-C-methyl-D-erythritol 4-phosphate cytidylyltransferase
MSIQHMEDAVKIRRVSNTPAYNGAMAETVGAIIVAGGSGTRMEGLDKLFTHLGGRPLLVHAVAAFEACPQVDRIVVVLSEANLGRGSEMLAEHSFSKLAGTCSGGPRRQDSVSCGLGTLGDVDWVTVHDGGRPLLKPALIARGLEAARETGAAVPVLPLSDTVKEVGEDGTIVRTLDRSRLFAVQTPQIFRYDLLMRAHKDLAADVTDDAAMVELLGVPVKTYEGSRRNLKITTPEDLFLAEAYLA